MVGFHADEFTVGDSFALTCSECHGPRLYKCLGITHPFRTNPWDLEVRWIFGACEVCGFPVVAVHDRIYAPDSEAWDDLTVEFPAAVSLPRDSVPESVRSAFAQAAQCFDLGLYEPAAVMARKAVEISVSERGCKARRLSDSLKELLDNQGIDADLYAWSDAVRLIGNTGAHEPTVTREDAQDSLAFAEALAERLFVMPFRFKRYKERRENASPPDPPLSVK